MSDASFLFRPYVDTVRVKSSHAKALARQLVNSAPTDLSASEGRSLDRMVACADEVQRALSAREHVSPERVGTARLGVITAAGALYGALEAMSRTPPEVSDRGARARAVLRQAFSDDNSFTKQDAPAMWASGLRRLEAIERNELRAEIIALVGEDMLVAFERALAALGGALGAGSTAHAVPSTSALAEKARTFSLSIASYCRVLAASVVVEDEASVERFRTAVAPIDEYRAQHARRRRLDEEELDVGDDVDVVEPAAPTTVVEPAPRPVAPQPAE